MKESAEQNPKNSKLMGILGRTGYPAYQSLGGISVDADKTC